jgi:hypothetical protein
MPDAADHLLPATWRRRSRFEGRKRIHNANEIMAEIVAKRLVAYLERAGFVVMKRPSEDRRCSTGARV